MGVFNTVLVLGGARSGKTAHALALCETAHREYGLAPIYIATAQAFDAEMTDRIARHEAERGPDWITIEAPLDLAAAIGRESAADRILLVDCLTLWLTNLMLRHPESDPPPDALDAAETELVAALSATRGPVVLVSNEVGLGIVPENKLARRFRDEAGRLNQRIAAMAGRVEFIAAGLPLVLKGQ